MPLDNPVVIVVAVEIAVALLFLIGCLLFFIRGQGRTKTALEDKIVELRDALKAARAELKAARAEVEANAGSGDFGEVIDEQINLTRNHHFSLSPERDIVLDIGPDTPLERRAVSLRHAFLIAEKEAWLAGDGEMDWDVLSSKLAQIIEFYEQPAPQVPQAPDDESDMFDALEIDDGAPVEGAVAPVDSEELLMLRETVGTQKRQIQNLERYKALFFATEDKWRAASDQAEQYHQLLLKKGEELGAGVEYHNLLQQYGGVYSEVGATLTAERDADTAQPVARAPEIDTDEPSVGRLVIANQEEIQRLRNMAVDQHKTILRLRDELNNAQSEEDKDRVIGELHKQLERHERFLKESDLCTKQLEDELDRVLNENHSLKIKLQDARMQAVTAAPAANSNVEQMVKLIEDFTEQSSEMLATIEVLEGECRELQAKLAAGGGQAGSSEELEIMRKEFNAVQRELAALQTEHVDLEERYLELKIKAG